MFLATWDSVYWLARQRTALYYPAHSLMTIYNVLSHYITKEPLRMYNYLPMSGSLCRALSSTGAVDGTTLTLLYNKKPPEGGFLLYYGARLAVLEVWSRGPSDKGFSATLRGYLPPIREPRH